MQLGTRWTFAATPPDRLPPAVRDAVARVEADVLTYDVDASTWRWTLTWLEGRPICELDDGTLVTIDPAGVVSITDPE